MSVKKKTKRTSLAATCYILLEKHHYFQKKTMASRSLYLLRAYSIVRVACLQTRELLVLLGCVALERELCFFGTEEA
jgi:hypothetical protein